MKKILIVIDMQNDFIYGALGNDDCRNAVKGCVDLCENGKFDKILFTRDTHYENYMETLEGKKLPVPHCLFKSDGWQIIPELKDYIKDPSNILDKITFGCERLTEKILNIRVYDFQEPCELHFAGVCTSICVLSNMTICRAAFPNMKIVLHRNATGDVTEEMKQAAFVCAKAIQCEIED